jgi:hypothetical protein
MQYLAPLKKGKTTIVRDTNGYTENVQAFAAVNHIPILPSDPTEKYQKLKHKTPQQCNKIIDKHKIKYFTPPPHKKIECTSAWRNHLKNLNLFAAHVLVFMLAMNLPV